MVRGSIGGMVFAINFKMTHYPKFAQPAMRSSRHLTASLFEARRKCGFAPQDDGNIRCASHPLASSGFTQWNSGS